MPLGPRKIFLANAVFILAFYTNLACLKKFNNKNVWQDNKRNPLYKNDYEMFAYYERYCKQSMLKYNKPRPRTLSKALLDPIPNQKGLQESLEELNKILEELDKTLEELNKTLNKDNKTLDKI